VSAGRSGSSTAPPVLEIDAITSPLGAYAWSLMPSRSLAFGSPHDDGAATTVTRAGSWQPTNANRSAPRAITAYMILSASMTELPTTFGKYFLTEKLATGGMAEIYLAKLLGPGGFEKQLVIKQIHPKLSDQRHFVDLFVTEAKTLVTLAHG